MLLPIHFTNEPRRLTLGRYLMVLLLTLAVLALSSPRATVAQRPPDCPPCTVTAREVLVVGELDGPEAISVTGLVRRDRRGRLWIARHDVKVFDPSGRVTMTIDRQGSGPGEFRNIRGLMITPADTVLLFDGGNTRIVKLAPDGRAVDHLPLRIRPLDAVVDRDETIVVNAQLWSEGRVGVPLHLVGRDGDIVKSFGAEPNPNLPIETRPDYRVLSPIRRPGRIWIAERDHYILEHWTTDGTLLTRWPRNVAWFPASQPERTTDHYIPNARINDIREDENGLVWVLAVRPDSDWASAVTYGDRLHGDHFPVINDFDAYYDSVIEVFDPDTETVIASSVFPFHILGFADDRHVFVSKEDQTGVPIVRLWEIGIRLPQ